jgi:hypothetical protein
MVRRGIATKTVSWRPIFEKRYHLREKGGADAFKNDHSFISKGTIHVESCILAHIITQKRAVMLVLMILAARSSTHRATAARLSENQQ